MYSTSRRHHTFPHSLPPPYQQLTAPPHLPSHPSHVILKLKSTPLSNFFFSTYVFFTRSQGLIFRAVEDADLILKARKGDMDAFNLLVSRWDRRVYNYILRLVNSREDALDLSQDTFLKAYQNLKKLEDVSRFAPWIFRIAHNEAYSLLRKRKPEIDADEGFAPGPRIHVGFVAASSLR